MDHWNLRMAASFTAAVPMYSNVENVEVIKGWLIVHVMFIQVLWVGQIWDVTPSHLLASWPSFEDGYR